MIAAASTAAGTKCERDRDSNFGCGFVEGGVGVCQFAKAINKCTCETRIHMCHTCAYMCKHVLFKCVCSVLRNIQVNWLTVECIDFKCAKTDCEQCSN